MVNKSYKTKYCSDDPPKKDDIEALHITNHTHNLYSYNYNVESSQVGALFVSFHQSISKEIDYELVLQGFARGWPHEKIICFDWEGAGVTE